MYDVDDRDQVTRLAGVPLACSGAPIPLVLSDGSTVVLAYYLRRTPQDWDGSWARIVGPTTEGEPVAIVRFERCYAHYFGMPNDEAFEGHPLASRGLEPYGAFEIQRSSWIRRLERMNSVHHLHSAKEYETLRHLIFAFHDETFECVCKGFDVALATGSIAGLVPEMTKRFRWGR